MSHDNDCGHHGHSTYRYSPHSPPLTPRHDTHSDPCAASERQPLRRATPPGMGEWCADTTSHCRLRRPNDRNEKQQHPHPRAARAARRHQGDPDMGIANLTPTKAKKGPTCEVCITLDRLPPAEAAALRGHLGNPEWRYNALSEALQAEGVDLPGHTLSRHARGQCDARERLRGA